MYDTKHYWRVSRQSQDPAPLPIDEIQPNSGCFWWLQIGLNFLVDLHQPNVS